MSFNNIKPAQELTDILVQSGSPPFDLAIDAQQKIADALMLPILYDLRTKVGWADDEPNKEAVLSIDWLTKFSKDGRWDVVGRCFEVLRDNIVNRLLNEKASGVDYLKIYVNPGLWVNDRCGFTAHVKYR